MNKTEFVKTMAEKTDMSLKDAGKAVDAFLEIVSEAMAAGDSVKFPGFGSFSVKQRAERTATNPITKEKVVVPATAVPSFKAGATLKSVTRVG